MKNNPRVASFIFHIYYYENFLLCSIENNIFILCSNSEGKCLILIPQRFAPTNKKICMLSLHLLFHVFPFPIHCFLDFPFNRKFFLLNCYLPFKVNINLVDLLNSKNFFDFDFPYIYSVCFFILIFSNLLILI